MSCGIIDEQAAVKAEQAPAFALGLLTSKATSTECRSLTQTWYLSDYLLGAYAQGSCPMGHLQYAGSVLISSFMKHA